MLSNENNRIRNPVEPQSIRNVLIVDDSRLQREILARSLRKWGYRVVEAESAEQALLLCASASFDLVLSDWMMPGMNGLDFCCAYRNLPNEEYGYFILLTSKSEKVEIARGLDAGADDFLTKPVNQSELRARITAGDRIIVSGAGSLTEGERVRVTETREVAAARSRTGASGESAARPTAAAVREE